MKQFLGLSLIITILLISKISQACIYVPSVSEAIPKYDIIFRGKYSECILKEQQEHIAFDVEKIWKGQESEKFLYKAQCESYFFKQGSDYLIYANATDVSNIIIPHYKCCTCARTTEIESYSRYLFDNFIDLF